MALQSGYMLHGAYEIVRIIGQGGFGITYEARHIRFNTRHAVKEYFPIGVAERSGTTVQPAEGSTCRENFARGLESFIREAQTLAGFSHPNIVSVQDFFQENGTAYLVMPFLVGETLDAVLQKCPGSKMGFQAVRQWLGPMLDGLAAVHAKGFMHRDIKPSNIYLTGNAVPILIDFGAARSDLGQLTHGFTIAFTPEYAPPEQHTTIANSQGPWTDIYAVGAVMYRCLMGTPPPDSNTRQLAVLHGQKDPVELSRKNIAAASDGNVAGIITRCLDLNSRTRIRSVGDLKKLLALDVSPRAEGTPGKTAGTEKAAAEKKNRDKSVPKKSASWKVIIASFFAAGTLLFACILFFSNNVSDRSGEEILSLVLEKGMENDGNKKTKVLKKSKEWYSYVCEDKGVRQFILVRTDKGREMLLVYLSKEFYSLGIRTNINVNEKNDKKLNCIISIDNVKKYTADISKEREQDCVFYELLNLKNVDIFEKMKSGKSIHFLISEENSPAYDISFSLLGFSAVFEDAVSYVNQNL